METAHTKPPHGALSLRKARDHSLGTIRKGADVGIPVGRADDAHNERLGGSVSELVSIEDDESGKGGRRAAGSEKIRDENPGRYKESGTAGIT